MGIMRRKKVCYYCKLPKFIFSKGLCNACYRKQYKPPPKPKLSKEEKKQQKDKAEKGKARKLEYKIKRAEYLNVHDHCEVALPDCLVPYPMVDPIECLTIHHKKGRTGDLLCDTNYFLACCINCHRYIEDHPEWAKDNGYSLSRMN